MERSELRIPDGLLAGMERQAALRGVNKDRMFRSAVRSELASYRDRESRPLVDLEELSLDFNWPVPGNSGRQQRL